jgi:hypothetical protein
VLGDLRGEIRRYDASPGHGLRRDDEQRVVAPRGRTTNAGAQAAYKAIILASANPK